MKISYVEQIWAAGLSSKEKSCRHSRSHNFDPIVFKNSINVGLIKLQIKFENKLWGAIEEAGPSSKKNYVVPRGRNIDSIFIKLVGKLTDIIKIINKLIINVPCGGNKSNVPHEIKQKVRFCRFFFLTFLYVLELN